jgi:hypothetical protein
VLAHLLGRRAEHRREKFIFRPGAVYVPALYVAVLLALLLLAPSASSPFIYFQF